MLFGISLAPTSYSKILHRHSARCGVYFHHLVRNPFANTIYEILCYSYPFTFVFSLFLVRCVVGFRNYITKRNFFVLLFLLINSIFVCRLACGIQASAFSLSTIFSQLNFHKMPKWSTRRELPCLSIDVDG